MRAEFFVELPMLAFAKQMQINLAHDRSVLIRITHHRLGPVPTGQTQMIIEIPGRVRHLGLKKTVAMNFLRFNCCLPVPHDVDLARVRTKRAYGEVVSHPMRPQNSEWIGMRVGKKTVQFIRRQTCDGKWFHDYST